MTNPSRERKGEIKAISKVTLNEEQKEAAALIYNNPITVITGRAGSGKSLVGAYVGLQFLAKKMAKKVLVTRATVVVGDDLGYLKGGLNEKFNPYIEAFMDNLKECADSEFVDELILTNKIVGCTVQFIRGKTINDVLVIEEAQNLNKEQMLALITRLGKEGKIIINGDNAQQDTQDGLTGLSYAIELSKKFPEDIPWIKLKSNHRHDLIGKILDYEYNK